MKKKITARAVFYIFFILFFILTTIFSFRLSSNPILYKIYDLCYENSIIKYALRMWQSSMIFLQHDQPSDISKLRLEGKKMLYEKEMAQQELNSLLNLLNSKTQYHQIKCQICQVVNINYSSGKFLIYPKIQSSMILNNWILADMGVIGMIIEEKNDDQYSTGINLSKVHIPIRIIKNNIELYQGILYDMRLSEIRETSQSAVEDTAELMQYEIITFHDNLPIGYLIVNHIPELIRSGEIHKKKISLYHPNDNKFIPKWVLVTY